MIRKNKAENPSVEENDNTWLGSNLYRLMLVVTVVWFAIVLIYITQFFRLVKFVFDDAGRIRRFFGRGNPAAGADLGGNGLR